VHLAVDGRGRPVRFILTPGQINDCTQALGLLDGFTPSHVIADKAYDTHSILDAVEAVGAKPIIPKRTTTNRPRAFDPAIYKRRNLVERTINKLKQLRRIATRYDRNPRLLLAFLCLVALSFWA